MSVINLTIGTNTTRKVIVVPDTTTVEQIIRDNEVSTSNCTLTLNGSSLSSDEYSMTLADLDATPDSMLIAIVASKAGR